MHRPLLVRGEGDIAADHDALRHRRVAGEAELGGDRTLVHLALPRERRLLAVDGDRASGDGAVLERPPHERRRDDGHAVVREAGRARVCELAHLGQLSPALALRDGGEEADRDLGLRLSALDQGAEDGRGVDDRIRIRHREDRAVAARRRRARARDDRLLVLATGRPQMDVWVDECGGEHASGAVDHAVSVRVDRLRELRDDAVVDADVEQRIDAARRIEDTCAADDEAVLRPVLAVEHQATSISTPASTGIGPWVSRS